MGDHSEQHAAEAQQEKKSGGSKLIFIVLGFVVLLGVIGVAAMFMLGRGSDEMDQVDVEITKLEPGYMYKFPQPFTGNLAAPDNEFIYSANVTLEIKERGDATEAEALEEIGVGESKDNNRNKMPYVRRIIMEEIGNKTRIDITSTTGRERIAIAIKNNLNSILDKSQIKEVFLEIFVN